MHPLAGTRHRQAMRSDTLSLSRLSDCLRRARVKCASHGSIKTTIDSKSTYQKSFSWLGHRPAGYERVLLVRAGWGAVVRQLRAHIGRCRFEQRSLLHRVQVRAEATVRCAGLLRAQVAAPRQEMPNLSDLSLRIANTNRAAARLPEPYGRRRLGGARNVTVACDGGAGEQAGVLHRDATVCAAKHAPWP